jgi:hypothetical protein
LAARSHPTRLVLGDPLREPAAELLVLAALLRVIRPSRPDDETSFRNEL